MIPLHSNLNSHHACLQRQSPSLNIHSKRKINQRLSQVLLLKQVHMYNTHKRKKKQNRFKTKKRNLKMIQLSLHQVQLHKRIKKIRTHHLRIKTSLKSKRPMPMLKQLHLKRKLMQHPMRIHNKNNQKRIHNNKSQKNQVQLSKVELFKKTFRKGMKRSIESQMIRSKVFERVYLQMVPRRK